MATQYVQVSGSLRIAYDVMIGSNEGNVYLLLPSLGDIRQEYRYLAPLLHRNGQTTVISVDLRGMGDSDVDFASYTPEDTGYDIIKLMEHLPYKKYILVGCSMSAASIVFAASKFVGRNDIQVEGLVLISPFLWDHPMPFGMVTLLNILLNRFTGASIWTEYYKSLYTLLNAPSNISVVEDLGEHTKKLQSNLSDPKRLNALRGHMNSSKFTCAKSSSAISDGKLPILLVYGSKDPDFPKGVEKEVIDMTTYFPNNFKAGANSLVLEGCGHYPHVEQPTVVADQISKMFSSL